MTTVCRTPATRTCWTEAGESRCARGEVFRIVLDGPDVGVALADCRTPAEPARSQ